MNCVNCAAAMAPYFTKNNFQIVRCPNCWLVAVQNIPEDLSRCYTEGYFTGEAALDGYMDYDYEKEVSRQTYIHYLDLLAKNFNQEIGLSLFEVGCATGFFMNLAQNMGWQVEGIDLSNYAVKKAREKGLSASVGTLEFYITNKKFHAVVMQDLIEHVRNPVATIKKAAEMLVDKGLLAITTPDTGSLWARIWGKHWHAFVPPQHLFYFSAKNLIAILKKNGFKVIYTAHFGKWFTLPYILRLLASWTGLKIFSKLAKWSAHSFLKRLAIPINAGDTVFLLAVKE